MIWWHNKQREKWDGQNKLFFCVSPLVLTITSATQKKLFCHQWILTRFRDEKLTSFQKIAAKLNLFCINSSVHKFASAGSKYLCGINPKRERRQVQSLTNGCPKRFLSKIFSQEQLFFSFSIHHQHFTINGSPFGLQGSFQGTTQTR